VLCRPVCCRYEAVLAAVAASWAAPGYVPVATTTGHWFIGRWWNDSSTSSNDDDVCTVVVDEFNFWSQFTNETRVTELGMRH